MKTNLFVTILLILFLASCAHDDVTATNTPAIRNLSSTDQKIDVARKPNQAPAANEDEGSSGQENFSGGRKLNIPVNQAELAEQCEKQLETAPEAYKNNLTNIPLNHRAIKISYNAKLRIPNWVYYDLDRQNLMNSCAKRKDKFRGDPLLAAAQLPKELIIDGNGYKNSGFDRGHMAPSGDFIWDQSINEDTFFMTNMSPQTAELNQKTWNALEEHVRNWACGSGELKVYTGPIVDPNMRRLNSCVSIPSKFFKVLAAKKDKKLVGIGFVYDQNDKAGDPYRKNAMSIRKVEELSGLNFFENAYAQKVQDEFETQFDINDWETMEENCYGCDGILKKK
jgi:endonuclease G